MESISKLDFLRLKKDLDSGTPVHILSGSMEPFIGTMEMIFIEPIPDLSNIKKFTPIVFLQKDILICHLFLEYKEIDGKSYVITRGLSRKDNDPPVLVSHILGQVSSPKMSFIQKILLHLFF